ncbi:hypothetical protein [Spiroplasma eriocheiris]|uniref:Uncharacterized protein n=1 Tax=Spiroplasma eriocheiris TaxID=315358 RepID=A0A0H3XKJ9_9MOLU|nr:hypothetical protein [Spiroplasma eriocheiris]AHF57487.1 hypothetical protein SPE_0358 [Spiroplasma eriocheiris CCTCC M 207170]AKM53944.1 hypothetical protein SERIO_v1c03620 [Spiroplasma eriocheiris]
MPQNEQNNRIKVEYKIVTKIINTDNRTAECLISEEYNVDETSEILKEGILKLANSMKIPLKKPNLVQQEVCSIGYDPEKDGSNYDEIFGINSWTIKIINKSPEIAGVLQMISAITSFTLPVKYDVWKKVNIYLLSGEALSYAGRPFIERKLHHKEWLTYNQQTVLKLLLVLSNLSLVASGIYTIIYNYGEEPEDDSVWEFLKAKFFGNEISKFALAAQLAPLAQAITTFAPDSCKNIIKSIISGIGITRGSCGLKFAYDLIIKEINNKKYVANYGAAILGVSIPIALNYLVDLIAYSSPSLKWLKQKLMWKFKGANCESISGQSEYSRLLDSESQDCPDSNQTHVEPIMNSCCSNGLILTNEKSGGQDKILVIDQDKIRATIDTQHRLIWNDKKNQIILKEKQNELAQSNQKNVNNVIIIQESEQESEQESSIFCCW